MRTGDLGSRKLGAEVCDKTGAPGHLTHGCQPGPTGTQAAMVLAEHQKGPEGHWEVDSQAEVGLSLWSFPGRMG